MNRDNNNNDDDNSASAAAAAAAAAQHRESVIARTKAWLRRCPEMTTRFYVHLEYLATGTHEPPVRLKGFSSSTEREHHHLNGRLGAHFGEGESRGGGGGGAPMHAIRLDDDGRVLRSSITSPTTQTTSHRMYEPRVCMIRQSVKRRLSGRE